jgi:fructose-bisphosphate aldolase, class II
MPIAPLTELLLDAQKRHYAVPSFNVPTLEMIDGVFRAAEELRSPVIIGLAARHIGHVDPWLIAGAVLKRAAQSKVPIVFHLDHAESLETVRVGVNIGCNSVMIDGSKLPFDANSRLTKEVTGFARPFGVTVEAELGAIGGIEGEIEGGQALRDYTDPDQAKKFVEETNVDALAVAIGTVHGFYKGMPNLQFELLKCIAEKTDVPLVLHGGTGLSPPDFTRLIESGIVKINVFTELATRCAERLGKNIAGRVQPISIVDVTAGVAADQAMVAGGFMTIFRSAGRA